MDLNEELQALHEELKHTNLLPYITQKQAKALAIVMGKCIKNKKQKRDIRLYALNEIAGDALWLIANVKEITSTKNLTGTMASVLIDLFLEDDIDWQPSAYGKGLIGALESEFEKKSAAGESNTGKIRVGA